MLDLEDEDNIIEVGLYLPDLEEEDGDGREPVILGINSSIDVPGRVKVVLTGSTMVDMDWCHLLPARWSWK